MKLLQTIAGNFDVNDFHLAQIRKIGDVYFPDAALDTHYNHICILKVERSFTMTTTVSACQLPSLEDRPKVRRNYNLHTILLRLFSYNVPKGKVEMRLLRLG